MGTTRREPETMTSHTTHRRAATGRRGRIGAFAAVLAASLLALVASASAHQLEIYKFQKFFTGSDATGGAFSSSIAGVAVNNSNGRVYVLDIAPGEKLRVSQFNANGEAQLFSGLEGVSSFTAREGVFSPEGADMVFDNTGHNEGLWVRGGNSGPTSIKAFREDGTKRVEGGPNFNLCGLGVNPTNGFLWAGSGQTATRLDPNTAFGSETYFYEQGPCHFTIDPAGNFYVNRISGTYTAGLFKYADESQFLKESFNPAKLILQFTKLNTKYTAFDTGDSTLFAVEGNPGNQVTQYSAAGQPIQTFGLAEGPFTGLAGARAVAVNPATQDVYVTSTDGSPRVNIFHRTESVTVPDATTDPAGHPNGTSAILKGTINPDGVKTTQCKFEWGVTSSPGEYSNGSIPCTEGNEFEGSTNQSVTNEITSLTLGSSFHYRVAIKNPNGRFTYGADRVFEASTPPTTGNIIVNRVNTDGARFNAEITPHGGTTNYHFEVGTEDCSSHECVHIPVADATLPSRLTPASVSQSAIGLSSGTGYFVRLVAENGAGKVSVSHFFHTYPAPPAFDPCANANVRKQTGASLLPDCRAYELVSAANAGGYEVESDLVPGETPFSAYPDAKERVLYGLHFGSIPGIAGSPTNDGLDPYVSERTNTGWVTKYVGIPADGMADPKAFGSPLLGADEALTSFAFGGAGICNPCFASGGGTNIPLRLNGAATTQGMLGTLSPSEPAPSGHVAKYLSADGSHLVFGSTKKFEEAGEEGVLTLYQRDLKAGTTQVVSTDQAGATLSGAVAELDQSSNGSRVVTGKVVSTDAAGNDHYHLYMHLGNFPNSVNLTPGLGSSALFDGMTSDGSRVFMTTSDQLLPGEDTDSTDDIYEAEVNPVGSLTLRLISLKNGAPSNDETCAPPGVPNTWNSVSGNGKCNAVAYADGAGLASGDGTFYFVSPEQLDGGNGIANQVNLYVVKPGGVPVFVAVVNSSLVKAPQGPAEHPLLKATFASAEQAEALAVNNSNGDVYVVQGTKGKISRFDSTGAAKLFTAGPGIGKNEITGFTFSTPSGGGVAVEQLRGEQQLQRRLLRHQRDQRESLRADRRRRRLAGRQRHLQRLVRRGLRRRRQPDRRLGLRRRPDEPGHLEIHADRHRPDHRRRLHGDRDRDHGNVSVRPGGRRQRPPVRVGLLGRPGQTVLDRVLQNRLASCPVGLDDRRQQQGALGGPGHPRTVRQRTQPDRRLQRSGRKTLHLQRLQRLARRRREPRQRPRLRLAGGGGQNPRIRLPAGSVQPDRQPRRRPWGQRGGGLQPGRLPGHPRRALRGLRHGDSGDRLRKRETLGDLPLRLPGRRSRMRLLRDQRRGGESRHLPLSLRDQHERRRKGLLHDQRRPGPQRHQRKTRRLRVVRRIEHRQHLDRQEHQRLDPPLGQPRRQGRLLLHPGRARAGR